MSCGWTILITDMLDSYGEEKLLLTLNYNHAFCRVSSNEPNDSNNKFSLGALI